MLRFVVSRVAVLPSGEETKEEIGGFCMHCDADCPHAMECGQETAKDRFPQIGVDEIRVARV